MQPVNELPAHSARYHSDGLTRQSGGYALQIHDITNTYESAPTGRLALWVGVWAALCAGIASIHSISNDNIPNVLIPISLLRTGDLNLNEFRPLIKHYNRTVCYWAVETPTGIYSRYPVWPGVLASPLFAPVAWFGPDQIDESTLLRMGRFVAVGCAGLFAALLVLALRPFCSAAWTIAITFFTLLGTTLLHQVGANLSNQTVPILCAAGLLALLRTPSLSFRKSCLIGIVAGLSVAARPPAILMALLPLGIFLSRPSWRRYLPGLIAGLAVFPAMTLLYQNTAFGGPFRTGYGDEPGAGFSAPFVEGLTGMLISPTCGLLIYSPWLIFGGIGAARCITGRGVNPHATTLGRWLVVGMVGQLAIFSKWWAWNGALCFGGARMLAEAIPALAFLIAIGRAPLNAFRAAPESTSLDATPAPPIKAMGLLNCRAGAILTTLGILSVILFAVGGTAFDVIAPTNPDKPDWNIAQDIIGIFIRTRGVAELAASSLKTIALLTATFLAGGYMTGRMLRPSPDAPGRRRPDDLIPGATGQTVPTLPRQQLHP